MSKPSRPANKMSEVIFNSTTTSATSLRMNSGYGFANNDFVQGAGSSRCLRRGLTGSLGGPGAAPNVESFLTTQEFHGAAC